MICYIAEHENLDIENLITPVKPDYLHQLLTESNYNTKETTYLVKGFKYGFDLGYEGPRNRRDYSNNLPLRVGSELELWQKIMKEVKLGWFAGPYKEIPFDNFVQSPVGLVPKAGGKTRLIFHLSYDFKKSGFKSVNHYTPEEKCTVRYCDLDHAVQQSLRLLNEISSVEGKTPIWYGKTDMESAYRVLPLSVNTFWLLVMMAKHPVTGETVFFVNKCLPFGHSMSCAIYQRFSNALAHMVKFLLRRRHGIAFTPLTNYQDDFLFAALAKYLCNLMLQTFLEMCSFLGVPTSEEKTEWGSTVMVFLGILLDGEYHILVIPEEK